MSPTGRSIVEIAQFIVVIVVIRGSTNNVTPVDFDSNVISNCLYNAKANEMLNVRFVRWIFFREIAEKEYFVYLKFIYNSLNPYRIYAYILLR